MRSKAIAIIACACALAVAVAAHLGTWEIQKETGTQQRYIQHERAASLDDLSEADRAAASSTSIDPDTFASHLPVVSIDTRGQEVPGDVATDKDGNTLFRPDGRYCETKTAEGLDYIIGDIDIIYDEGSANQLSDEPIFSSQTRIRYRGHRSRDFPKRNYSLHFVDEEGNPVNEGVLGMPADNGWILNGPYLDKSLIRNYLAYNVFGTFCEDTPEVRFCELFVNDEYRGLFLLMEAVDVSENRVDLTETEQGINNGPETSYMLKLDRYDMEAVTLDNLGSQVGLLDSSLEVMYPKAEALTDEQLQWIQNDFSAFEKALYSYDYDTADYGYWNYIDVDSFVAYFIANEFSMNYDAGLYSTYLSRDLRSGITIGPIWDFNSAFDNYAEADYSDASGFTMVNRPWFTMLVKDEDFIDAVINRYRQLRQDVLSDEYLSDFIDSALDYLGPAIDRNWKVWGSTFEPSTVKAAHRLIPIERNPTSYGEAIDELRVFIDKRGTWLDAHIESLKQYSHESAVKMDNH